MDLSPKAAAALASAEATTQPVIPANAVEVLGHNRALALFADMETLQDRLSKLLPATAANAPFLRDLMKQAHDKAGELEEERMEAQKPATQEVERIRAAYRPLHERALAVKEGARQGLNVHLEAERVRLEAERRDADRRAQEASAEAARAAQQATAFDQPHADDLAKVAAEAAVDALYAGKVADSGPRVGSASGIARAGGQRVTWSAKVTDPAKAAKHFAKHPDMAALLTKLASAQARATKGSSIPPGCEAVETRNAI